MEERAGGRWRFLCKPVPGSDHGPVAEQLCRNGVLEFETIATFSVPEINDIGSSLKAITEFGTFSVKPSGWEASKAREDGLA